ncbi:hypothetical protein AA0311_2047 [Asaia bogorensis NBRC 16594]|uniref:Uncharacterized protein n=1 Tax=Asaia bogorensis NBRC 16594 TaxID=1231624 RepID=A0AAN4R080_9PROT|nr:hypothetical protein AA0311_2047 [Asaia bogorensis NBRC 16594]GEL52177.1 hypothetical protein ABO01nite_01840 [Asaia bogorensis NBRC 16594]
MCVECLAEMGDVAAVDRLADFDVMNRTDLGDIITAPQKQAQLVSGHLPAPDYESAAIIEAQGDREIGRFLGHSSCMACPMRRAKIGGDTAPLTCLGKGT